MPSPMSPLSFAGGTTKANAKGADALPVDDMAGTKDKPDFGTLVRRESKAPASSRPDGRGTTTVKDDTPPAGQATRTAARRAPKPEDDAANPLLALAWLAEAHAAATPGAGTPPAIAPTENPLLVDAAAGLVPPLEPRDTAFVADAATATAPLLPAALGQDTASAAPLPADIAPPDTALPAEAAAPADATPAPTTAQVESAKPALQNLLSFATHLATGNVAAAVPEALALGKDVVDALHGDDTDAPAPTGNTLAGLGNTASPLGLARTATVNATEAPSADLHGGHFDEEIGDSVRWMADQKIGHAHIKITPNELGTVEVRLRLDGDRVHADFTSAQAEVRQALENSLPRLRDMLGQHGFQLAHADVGQHHQPSSQAADTGHGGSEAGGGPAGSGDADLPRPVRMTALGLLDAYA